MANASERTQILKMISDGIITAEEAAKLLDALDETTDDSTLEEELLTDSSDVSESEPSSSPDSFEEIPAEYGSNQFQSDEDVLEPDMIYHSDTMPKPPDPDEINKWKRWWVIPMWVGVGITVFGGLIMYLAYANDGFGFWFACAWFPFMLGVLFMSLAWGSRTTPWLHVRIQQRPGQSPQKIAISFPLPIRLAGWGLRTFGQYIPNMEGMDLENMLVALNESARDGTPFFVDVDDEDGERVQIFIG
jgi:hypothetical protein